MKLEFRIVGQNYQMNLRELSDEKLHSQMLWLCEEERNLLTPILYLLREVEVRKLFSAKGYKNLFEYTIKECGFSEDQAARRISAMRLLKELPEIEEKISSGELSLTNLNQAQTLFKAEHKCQNSFSKEQKLEVLKSLENKTKREAEKIVLSLSSQPGSLKPEKIRIVSENFNEIRTSISDETLKKIEKLKGLLAHSNPSISLAELIDKLCDLGINEWDLGKKQVRERKASTGNKEREKRPRPAPARVTVRQKSTREHIANSTQREVWKRFNSQCAICKSTHALEIDHIIPKAKGGLDAFENLRLLCRNCNQRSAIEHYGIKKMESYLKEPEAR